MDIHLINESNPNYEITIDLINSNPLNFDQINLQFNLNSIHLFRCLPLTK